MKLGRLAFSVNRKPDREFDPPEFRLHSREELTSWFACESRDLRILTRRQNDWFRESDFWLLDGASKRNRLVRTLVRIGKRFSVMEGNRRENIVIPRVLGFVPSFAR